MPTTQQQDRPLSTGGYVVLGLLLDEPATGWDLAAKIERSIAHFWPLTRAHVYAELPKLVTRRWATAATVPQTGAPDRRVHTATDSGRTAFRAWLADVDLTEERGRQPLQLQLFFAAHGDPAKMDELLTTWKLRAEAAEAHCADILGHRGLDAAALGRLSLKRPTTETLDSRGQGQLDPRGMTALFGLRRAQADLVWLDEVRLTRPSREQQ